MISPGQIWENIRDYRLNSILVKNFLFISLVLMLPLGGFSFLFYLRMSRAVEDEIQSLNMASLEHLRDVTEGVFYDMDQMSLLFSLDKNVRLSFSADRMAPLLLDQYDDIFDLVNSFTMIYDYVDSVYFYAEKPDYVIGKDGGTRAMFRDGHWYNEYRNHSDSPDPWIMSRLKYGIYPYLLTLVRPVYTVDRSTKLGAVMINLNIEEFRKFCRNENGKNQDRFYIADSTGRIILSDRRNDLFTPLSEQDWFRYDSPDRGSYMSEFAEQSAVVSHIASNTYGLTYISVLPLVSYQSKTKELLNYFILILLLCLATSLCFSLYITLRTFQPIYRIINLLEHPALISGSRDGRSSREVQLIADKIFRLINSNDELRGNLELRLGQLEKARIVALQNQINPHFLYNTLETIRWLTVELTGNENRPSSMIASLSRLLRLSLDTDEEFITLEQEVEHAQNYLDLMLVRYEEKMDVRWHIDKDLLSCRTVKLILQPLIENAIYHGIKPKSQKGLIEITAMPLGDSLILLTVKDDGPGMDREKLDELNLKLSSDADLSGRHIGLANVNQRIKLKTGNEFGVRLKNGIEGLCVEILIPRFADQKTSQ